MATGYIFYNDISFITCRGIVNGYVDGLYRPNNNTIRGQFAKIVVRGFGIPSYTPASPTFNDVPTAYTFYPFIEAAVQAGVMQGYGSSTFGPDRAVNRVETVVTLQRIRNYPLYIPTTPTFSDVPADSFGFNEVETFYHRGILSGQPCKAGSGTCFRRFDYIIRGEMAKVARRAIEDTP